ncbi:MAG TPA: copper-containing nitrite reductase [Rhodopila sp.]|nr:copper-containing nitrite reductase [Rhodopila sp.]
MSRLSFRQALALSALGLPLLLPPGSVIAAQPHGSVIPAQPHGSVIPAQPPAAASGDAALMMTHAIPNATFTLRTGIAQGKMVYIGKGGAIDGKVNPTLTVHEGDVVQITIINGEGAEHDVVVPDLHVSSQRVIGRNASSTLVLHAADVGSFVYFCSVPGHREAGMEGLLKVEPAQAKTTDSAADISRDPADVPPPIGERGPTTARYELEAIERMGRLADDTTYDFWTFNGKVPGPMLRVRVGDTVVLSLKNAPDSVMMHNIDLHAVNGPGGGAMLTEVTPGETKAFTFKALQAGLFVYHCATPMVANHISNGMYGMILVEPVGGLPPVDREFYVMQGELYTNEAFGHTGLQEFSVDKLMDEHPEYFVFNGSVGALTARHPLHAKTGETVRIYFGVGGPNFTSSFHVIGTIFDKVYNLGSLTSPPATGVQTVSVPPGGATAVEIKLPVPGRFAIVDHALARMERGLVGALLVDGPANPATFHAGDGTQATATPVVPATLKKH